MEESESTKNNRSIPTDDSVPPGRYNLRIKIVDENRFLKTKKVVTYEQKRASLMANNAKYELYKLKDALRAKNYRKNMTSAQKAHYNEKTKIRMRKLREKHRDKQPEKRLTRNEKAKLQEHWRLWKRKQRESYSPNTKNRMKAQRREAYARKVKKRLDFSEGPKCMNAQDILTNLGSATPNTKQTLKVEGLIFTPDSKLNAVLNAKIAVSVKETLRELRINKTKEGQAKYRWFVKAVAKRAATDVKMRKKLEIQHHFWKWCLLYDEEEDGKQRCDAMTSAEQGEIKDYYVNQSEQLPCKKLSRGDISKSVLMKTTKELHEQFKDETGKSVSLSTFRRLRPKSCLTVKMNKFAYCLCEYCINVEFVLRALRNSTIARDCTLSLQTKHQISRETVCSDKHDCLVRRCKDCGVHKLKNKLQEELSAILQQDVTWQKWKTGVVGPQKEKRKVLVDVTGTVEDCINDLCNQAEKYSLHLFAAYWQRQQLNHLRSNPPEGWLVSVADFAENYRCVTQDECSSAYYSYTQATLVPIICYYKCPTCKDRVVAESVVFVTPDLHHDPHTVNAAMGQIKNHLEEKRNLLIIHEVQVSDGCGNQFKSKLPLYFMSQFEAERVYFGSRHGKSVCDGLAGTIKQKAELYVKSRQGSIRNAKEFYDWCVKTQVVDEESEECTHTKRVFFYADKIPRPDVPDLVTMPGTQSVHQVKTVAPGVVKARQFACYCTACLAGGRCENADTVNTAWGEPFILDKLGKKAKKAKKSKRRGQKSQTDTKQINKKLKLSVTNLSREKKIKKGAKVSKMGTRSSGRIRKPNRKWKWESSSDSELSSDSDWKPLKPKAKSATSKSKVKGATSKSKTKCAASKSTLKGATCKSKAKKQTVLKSEIPILDVLETTNKIGKAAIVLNSSVLQSVSKPLSQKEIENLTALVLPHSNPTLTVLDLRCTVDDASLNLLPNDISRDLYPVTILGDGNCLARTASLISYGTQDRYVDIKVALTYEMMKNREFYTLLYGHYAMFSPFFKNNMNTKCEKDLNDIFAKELTAAITDGEYLSMWHMAAMATVLNRSIMSVYPQYAGHTVRKAYHRVIQPRTGLSELPTVHIMWTNTSGTFIDENKWKPNHFVPLLPLSEKVEDIQVEDDNKDELVPSLVDVLKEMLEDLHTGPLDELEQLCDDQDISIDSTEREATKQETVKPEIVKPKPVVSEAVVSETVERGAVEPETVELEIKNDDQDLAIDGAERETIKPETVDSVEPEPSESETVGQEIKNDDQDLVIDRAERETVDYVEPEPVGPDTVEPGTVEPERVRQDTVEQKMKNDDQDLAIDRAERETVKQETVDPVEQEMKNEDQDFAIDRAGAETVEREAAKRETVQRETAKQETVEPERETDEQEQETVKREQVIVEREAAKREAVKPEREIAARETAEQEMKNDGQDIPMDTKEIVGCSSDNQAGPTEKDARPQSAETIKQETKKFIIGTNFSDGNDLCVIQMYLAFGGTTKGLSFKDLTCGLVLLTRGRQEEKMKFVFGLYANEALTHVEKEEMDRLVLATEGQVPSALSELFKDTDRVTFEYFKDWLVRHADVTSVTRWMIQEPYTVTLSNDLETPTFYQTLAGVTHLEETDIIELEKRYWMLKAQSKTGLFDLETFKPIMCPPVPEALCQGLFYAFDENRDDHIDFKEMACGISACCRGPMTERQKFCFKVFDKDHDGLLNKEELEAMVAAMLIVRQENTAPEDLASQNLDDVTPALLTKTILENHDSDDDDCLTQEDYLVWTVNHLLPNVFLDLLFQVCHVVLGLKPHSIEDEGKVISGWLEREERRGLQSGQVWYLMSMTWWKQWLDYVNYRPVYGSALDDGTIVRRVNSSTGSRAGSICRNLARKASFGVDEPGSSVVGTSYTVLSGTNADVTNSPVKYASLPQANHVVSQSPHGSPLRVASADATLNPNSVSRTTTPSPSPSPKLGKKAIAPQVMQAQRPGAIDNNSLIVNATQKVMTLTNEGGRLKRDKMLARGRDFELVPESVWKCLSSWYGGSPALPRTVISPLHGDSSPELELYPISVKLYRHQNPQQRPQQVTSFTGMIGGMGGMAVSTAGLTNSTAPSTPRRYLAYTAAFSRKHTLRQVYEFLTVRLRINREDMRLWKLKDDSNMTLLEEEDYTMEELVVEESQQMLIEVRNKDLTWPEELSQLAKNKSLIDKKQQVPTERGATGLNNLGNTCFMNSALQCVSNTRILTLYLNGGMHLYELNRTNPLGMKGHIAQRYGELVKDLWSGTTKSLAPLKLRWTIGKYAPRFNGFQQHDSQELLAFLLDGLHEDLNRVHDKPYVELKDSDGRADEIVAKEAWENHLLRNRSVIVDLFHGQLKSCVRCLECGHTSVRFDPFTYLSLPLPMDSCIHLEIIVMRLDGSVPVKYGLRLNMDEKYKTLKKQLSDLSGIPAMQILLVEIFGALVKSLPQDHQKIRNLVGGALYAYELPPMNMIPPMTMEDERKEEDGQGAIGLNQIQRMHSNKSLNGGKAVTQQPISTNSNQPTQEPVGNAGDGQSLTTGQNGGPPSQPPVVNGTTNGSLANGPATNHNRNESNASTATSTVSTIPPVPDYLSGCVVAVHRKMIRMDVYFLSSQKTRPSLFGTPLILSCEDRTTNQDVYQMVWTQVSRLVSPLPPSESGTPNHAQDCDDSLAYEFPFTLKAVQKDGFTCAWCPWYRFCRGCKIDCNTNKFRYCTSFIAVDWEPTALHLRYQTSQERVYAEHASVEESRRLQTEPIDLDTCLKAFTKEEELGEDELYYCSKCKDHRLAAKKLDIWRLPPVLIIHLKRFQFMNGRWVKSHKIVKFPFRDFDPTNYLVPRKGSTDDITTVPTVNGGFQSSLPIANGQAVLVKETMSDVNRNDCKPILNKGQQPNGLDNAREATEDAVFSEEEVEDLLSRKRPHSLSVEYHEDYTDVRYNLYSLSCHTGILGGGHYVSYAKNPNSKWYIYNDSSCKEMTEEQVDSDTAYMLFYERQSLDYNKFMPDVTGREPDTSDIEDEFESDFKRMCVIS